MNGSDSTPATVILVEDDTSMREALEALFAAAGYRSVGFASGERFLAAPIPPPPCCLLLDLQLDGQSGLAVQQHLNACDSFLPVVFLSGDDSIAHAVRAMKQGALDFLQKPVDPEQLLERVERALQASAEGDSKRRAQARATALLAELTAREHQVLALLANGNINKEVARKLEISVRTAESHRKHIMDKLGATSLADLVHVWLNGTHT